MACVKIALGQMRSGIDKKANIEQALRMAAAAQAAGAKILVLPEAAQVSFAADLPLQAEPLDGAFASAMRQAAIDGDLLIIAGMFQPAANQRVKNTVLLFGHGVEDTYNKVHLFDAFGARESDTVEAGDHYVVVKTPFGTIGIATCFDLRFSEQFSTLAKRGAEIIAVCASWGDGPAKAEQWDLLTRARAADAQCWVLACGQAWQPPQGTAPLGIGRSAVIDPTGMVRSQAAAAPELLLSEIDLSLVQEIRARIPIL